MVALSHIHDANNGFPMPLSCVSHPLIVFIPSTRFPSCAFCWSPFSSEVVSTLPSQIDPFYLQACQYPWGQCQGGTEALGLELEFTGGLSRSSWALCTDLRSCGSSTHTQMRSHLPCKHFLMNDHLWSSSTSIIRSFPCFRQQFS